jgi:hypothetical protein
MEAGYSAYGSVPLHVSNCSRELRICPQSSPSGYSSSTAMLLRFSRSCCGGLLRWWEWLPFKAYVHCWLRTYLYRKQRREIQVHHLFTSIFPSISASVSWNW